MIVDDEEPVLDSFAFIIKKHIFNFTLCAKARSGTEAIKLIPEMKPDLVFMDIHMPGIDGIDTITEIRKHNPNIVFILATAYERFDIAQRAIPLGVFSYLVKPVSRNTLIEEFRKVEAHLDDLKEKHNHHIEDVRILNKTKEEIKNRFLSGIVWGDPNKEEWEEFCHLHSLSCTGGIICIVDIPIGTPVQRREFILSSLNEKICFKYKSYQLAMSDRILQFFPDSQDLEKIEARYKSFTGGFNEGEVSVGRGGLHAYSSLHLSYCEALKELKGGDETRSFLADREKMESICDFFIRGEFDEARRAYDELWNEKFRLNGFGPAKGVMISFYTLLFTRIDGYILDAAKIDINPPEDIIGLPDVKDWKVWSEKALESIERVLTVFEKDLYPQQLMKAIALIHKEYSAPIRLSTVASECDISKSYLSRLFGEYLNMSFVDYLNKYRVDKAVILLRDKNYPVKEASRLVGYQDPNYFSRIFRRYTGLSPSDLGKRRKLNEA